MDSAASSFRARLAPLRAALLKNAHDIVEIAYLSQPDGGDFTVEADGSATSATVETAAETKTPGLCVVQHSAAARTNS